MKKSELKQLIKEIVNEMDRKEFLKTLGLTAGVAAAGGMGFDAITKAKSGDAAKSEKDADKIIKIFSEIITLRHQAKEVASAMSGMDDKETSKPIAVFNKRLMDYANSGLLEKYPKEREALYALYMKKDELG